MKNLLLTAALVIAFAAPALANEPAAATTTTTTATTTTTVDTAAVAKEACTKETNEKVKLPENAGDAEKAQWDAAFAECVKGKGIEDSAASVTTTTTTTDAVPADVDPEAAADMAAPKAAH